MGVGFTRLVPTVDANVMPGVCRKERRSAPVTDRGLIMIARERKTFVKIKGS